MRPWIWNAVSGRVPSVCFCLEMAVARAVSTMVTGVSLVGEHARGVLGLRWGWCVSLVHFQPRVVHRVFWVRIFIAVRLPRLEVVITGDRVVILVRIVRLCGFLRAPFVWAVVGEMDGLGLGRLPG
jgi:hypothetical protein